MATSQNGYSVPLTAAEQAEYIRTFSLVGGTIRLRNSPTSTVLLYVAHMLHTEVQGARWPGIWGFAIRPVRGQTSGYSNHASGTAMDWNAPLHPRHSERISADRYAGWSSGQVETIRKILAFCDGVVRWGADYKSGPYDPMHFEINKSIADVEALAKKIEEQVMPLTNADARTVLSYPLTHSGTTAPVYTWITGADLHASLAWDAAKLADTQSAAALAQSKANAATLSKIAEHLGVAL